MSTSTESGWAAAVAAEAQGLAAGNAKGLAAVQIVLLDDGGRDISASWRPRRATVVDQLSGECHATLELESRDREADIDALMGQAVTVELRRATSPPVRFSGIVTWAGEEEWQKELLVVQARVEPAFQCLRERTETRRFVGMTRPDILRVVLDPLLKELQRGIELRLARAHEKETSSRRYPTLDFVQQRGESTYRFCCRLMAEEGIAFCYDHTGATETLILVDANSQFLAIAEEFVELIPPGGNVHNVEAIQAFSLSRSRGPNRYDVRAFDVTRASLSLEHQARIEPGERRDGHPSAGDGTGAGESYDPLDAFALHAYDGEKYTLTDMECQAELRLQARRREVRVGVGGSQVLRFAAGRFFTLDVGAYHQQGLDGRYLLTTITHRATVDNAGDGTYGNTFRCIPEATPFRPARIAKPVAAGIDLAVVVTPGPNHPIYSDRHGRVRVRFKWDRQDGEPGPDDSCWIPVRQGWAGQGFGFQIIPRDGMIVTVEYMGGDVDRPVVTGCVPTSETVLPYPQDKHTTFGVRTQSLRPDGNGGFFTEHYSELAIDDTANDERFYVRAGWNFRQDVLHDHVVHVRHDEQREVGHCRSTAIKANETVSVGGNRFETVEQDQSTTILNNEVHQVKEAQQLVVGGGRHKDIGKLEESVLRGGSRKRITGSDDLEVSDGNKNTKVHGQYNITADEHFVVRHGDEQLFLKDGAYLETLGDIQLTNPGCHVTLGKDGALALNAVGEISLSCGPARVSLTADGTIEIVGALVKIN